MCFSLCGSTLLPKRTWLEEFNNRSWCLFVGWLLETQKQKWKKEKKRGKEKNITPQGREVKHFLQSWEFERKMQNNQILNKKSLQIRKIRQSP